MDSAFDAAIIGAGPAGCSAAIWAARSGLRTVLLDLWPAAKSKPGETLHPGSEPIFAQLGVLNDILAANFLRHDGYIVQNRDGKVFVPYSRNGEQWYGFQAVRSRLEAILASAAMRAGALLRRPVRAIKPILEGGRVCGLICANHEVIRSRFLIDCTGNAQWLRRQLGISAHYASERLIARYGYFETPALGSGACPVFRWGDGGWSWSAPVSERRHAFVSLNFSGCRGACNFPLRGAEVTWRLLTKSAGPGYFVAGDAATVLDPAGSHGVIKALMSGIMAAHLIEKILRGSTPEPQATEYYRSLAEEWFWRDAVKLRQLYSDAQRAGEFPEIPLGASTPTLRASP